MIICLGFEKNKKSYIQIHQCIYTLKNEEYILKFFPCMLAFCDTHFKVLIIYFLKISKKKYRFLLI
jgi:hypothetical protein